MLSLFNQYIILMDFIINVILFYFSTVYIKKNIIISILDNNFQFICFTLSILFAFIWILNALNSGYYSFKRIRSVIDEFFIIFPITLTSYLELVAIYVLLGGILWHDYSFFHRRFFVFSLLTQTIGLLIYQIIVIKLFSILHKKGYNIKTIVLAGINDVSLKISEIINKNPLLGYKVIGYFDDNFENAQKFNVSDKYLGNYDEIENYYFNKQNFDNLICCLTQNEYEKTKKILNICDKNNINLLIVPDVWYFITSKSVINNFEGIPIVTIYKSPLSGFNAFLKRMMDIIISLLAIIILSPLLLLIAILVKLSSKGPVFYVQERVGLDNKPFMMYKFRSMYIDSEEKTGPKWADKNDPRCTKIGAFLRKTSLDELPQLFNVLKGEMSLVGPRPERPFFVQKFKEEISDYMKRHRVKAGITGWAQVNGLRGSSTSLTERIKYDLYYIENWSLWFDIKILFKTLFVIWTDKNAY